MTPDQLRYAADMLIAMAEGKRQDDRLSALAHSTSQELMEVVRERDALQAELAECRSMLTEWMNLAICGCVEFGVDSTLCERTEEVLAATPRQPDAQSDALRAELAECRAKLDEATSDKEIGEFQDDVRNLLMERLGKLGVQDPGSIDGGGGDSGDWRDFTMCEIGQALDMIGEHMVKCRANLNNATAALRRISIGKRPGVPGDDEGYGVKEFYPLTEEDMREIAHGCLDANATRQPDAREVGEWGDIHRALGEPSISPGESLAEKAHAIYQRMMLAESAHEMLRKLSDKEIARLNALLDDGRIAVPREFLARLLELMERPMPTSYDETKKFRQQIEAARNILRGALNAALPPAPGDAKGVES